MGDTWCVCVCGVLSLVVVPVPGVVVIELHGLQGQGLSSRSDGPVDVETGPVCYR